MIMISKRTCVGFSLFLAMSLGAVDPIIPIERLTDQAVEQCKTAFASAQEKNKLIRKIAKTGSYILGAAAAIGCSYAYCKRGSSLPVAAFSGSLEELRKEVAALKEQVQGPNFASKAWLKSMAWNILLSPTSVIGIAEHLGTLGLKLANRVFYVPTVCWYINGYTSLGELGMGSKALVPGILAKELERNAMMLDDPSKMLIPFDHEYHKKMIIFNFNKVVADITGLVAFMQYNATLWNNKNPLPHTPIDEYKFNQKRSLEALEQARYLFNYTNNMSSSLERALSCNDSAQEDKKQLLVPLIKGFFAELEQILISFIHIEQEKQYEM